MSGYAVIADISASLRELLRTHITFSTLPQINGVPIDLRSPRELRAATVQSSVSLWLYRVIRSSDLLNHPRPRPTPDQLAHPAMPVSLHYLVTPITPDPGDEQALLGRVIQVFNDHATLRGADLRGNLEGSSDEYRLHIEPMTLEDITRVWNSLQESYQLSVSYEVSVVSIDSHHEPVQSSPVLVREATYAQIVDRT